MAYAFFDNYQNRNSFLSAQDIFTGQSDIFHDRSPVLPFYLYNTAPLYKYVNAAFVKFCDHFHDGTYFRANFANAL